MLELNCLIYGNDHNRCFTVKISETEYISILKEFIKDTNKPELDHLAAHSLKLWKLCPSIPYAEIGEKLGSVQTLNETVQDEKKRKLDHLDAVDLSTLGCIELPPLDDLSDHFSSLIRNHLHIIVQLPPAREASDNKESPSKRSRHVVDEFVVFHHQYWGHPLDHALTTLSTYDSNLETEEDLNNDVLPGEPFLNVFGNHFLVKAEYIRALNAVKEIFKVSQKDRLAVVTGQPGIGKTLWIYYALRYCLGEEQPVILFQGGEFHFFSNDGVKLLGSTSQLHSSYTWCFVDSTAADRLPDRITHPNYRLFPIYVTSPKQERWNKLHQIRQPSLVIMNPWTKAELEKAAKLYPNQELTDIFERFHNAGPSARYCLRFSQTDISDFYSTRDRKINFATTQPMLTALLDNETQQLRISDISHGLCVVRRSDSQSVRYVVEPISAFIRHRLLTQLWEWKVNDRIDMMKSFSRIPEAAGISGLLFESVFHHRFSEKIEIDMTRMFRAPNPRSRWHAMFGDFSKNPKLCGAWQEASSTGCSRKSLSISPSECQAYDHGKSKPVIKENIYYVPLAGNEVAIDSFIIHDGHLYMFRFASGPQHDVNPGILATLQWFSHLPSTNLHLVFIVPNSLDKFSCPHSDDGFLCDHVPYVAQVDAQQPADHQIE